MMKLHVDKELKDFIKPLQEDEFEALGINIRDNGCIEPIVVWNHNKELTVVDGHHRYKLCIELGVPFKTVKINFKDKLAAMTWMYEKQKGRRNLSIGESLNLARKLVEYGAEQASERKLSNLKQFSGSSKTAATSQSTERCPVHLSDKDQQGKTIEKLAKKSGTSYKSAFKYDAIMRKGTDQQKEAVNTGQKKVGTVYKEIQAKANPANPQSNECDIEKLFKGKTINTPYLVLYSRVDEATGKQMRACLSNSESYANLLAVRDYMLNSLEGKCLEDDFVQLRLSIRRVVEYLKMLKSEV